MGHGQYLIGHPNFCQGIKEIADDVRSIFYASFRKKAFQSLCRKGSLENAKTPDFFPPERPGAGIVEYWTAN